MVVKTWVFRVGRWMTFLPMSASGIWIPSGKILSQDQHLALGLVGDPGDVLVRQVEALEAVLVEDGLVLVLDLALVGVDDDGAVLDG